MACGAFYAVVLAATLVTVSASAASAPVDSTPHLHTDGSRIVTESGEGFTIRAVNWFGLETSNCAPHGLWTISLDQAMDQIASSGFNAIRLPFSSECLAASASAVSGVDAGRNPTLVGKTPLQIMDRVVDAAAARHLRVILDRHRPDSGSQSELWYTARFSERQWIADWVSLAGHYRNRPAVIGADLHNEPHGPACWGCGDPATDWPAAATRAGNATLAANPDWLIFVEGVERQRAAGTTWWGGGLADAATRPITLTVPHRLVYSAHDYPASVYQQRWFTDPGYPANLPALWDRNWGYLQQQNIAPVLLGEFGTKLDTASDRAWLTTLVGYLVQRRISFAYWSYNPNSGDTGGVVADDWQTPQQAKLAALAPLLPAPHALGRTTGPSAPTVVSTLPATRTTAAPPASTSSAPSMSSALSTRSAPSTSSRPTVTASAQPPSTPGSGRPAVSWQLRTEWPTGYVADLDVRAAGAAVAAWRVSWPDPQARSISSAWGMTCSVAAGRISCAGAGWAAAIPAGGRVQVGLVVVNDGNPPRTPALTIG